MIDKEVWTPQELAERWQCSDRTIHGLCNCGSLPAFRVGRMFRIRIEAIEAYEAAGSGQAVEPGASSKAPMQVGSDVDQFIAIRHAAKGL